MSRKFIVLFRLNGKQIRKKFSDRDEAVRYARSVESADKNIVGVYDNHFCLIRQFYIHPNVDIVNHSGAVQHCCKEFSPLTREEIRAINKERCKFYEH